VLVILVAGAIIMVGSTGAEQAANLAARIPELLRGDMLANMDVPGWMIPLRDRLIEALRGNANEVGKDVMPLIGSAAGGLATGLDLMVHGILIPIVAFFFLKDGRHIRTTLIEMSPEEHRYTVMGILDDLSHLLENYIRALLILSLATFVCYLTFLEITGAPYAELLALVAGFFEFIPAIGPFIAATTIILVAVISGYKQWLLLLGFFAVYRLFQDYILQPALMSQGVELHPLLVLFGALAGAEIAGVPGVFFSVPLMAGARMIYYRIYQRKVESPVI
jgi:predicted PurR-regulated permease PerM